MNLSIKLAIPAVFILLSCKKDVDPTIDPAITIGRIEGVSQKGPLLNGSSLTTYELDASLTQTGKSFNTQILDNLGSFQINNLTLLTPYAKLKADGFYFNEITNSNSLAAISLYALSDFSNKNTINVNLLSTLEVSRIEYLVSNGLSFANAKKQAQQEVLNIFSIRKNTIQESELLDISQNTDDNAILLAISLILQGYRNEAGLTQLLGDINTDIRTDGVLNSPTIGTALINDANLLNLPVIRANIENKYISLGVSTVIPDFEKYIKQFKDSTGYSSNNNIRYNFMVNTRQNLLKDTAFAFYSGSQNYCLGAYLPIGTSLKVLVKPSPGFSSTGAAGPVTNLNNGWTYTVNWPDSTVFRATGNNQTVDIPFMNGPPTSIDVFIFENGASVPTRTKTVVGQ